MICYSNVVSKSEYTSFSAKQNAAYECMSYKLLITHYSLLITQNAGFKVAAMRARVLTEGL